MVNKRKNADGSGGKKKRPKKYYVDYGKKNPKKNALSVGDKGFLITCNGDERGAVIEAYRILNQFADIRYGPEKIVNEEAADEEVDIESALKKELSDIKSASSGQVERRFQSVQTKSSNVVFIKTNVDDPCALVNDVFSGFESGSASNVRHCLKFVPVLETCHASNDEIVKRCSNTLIPTFFQGENEKPKKFCLTWKVRCNTTVNREAVYTELVRKIEETGAGHVTDYIDPDVALFIEIIGNVCGMGVLQHFKRFRKYNLQIVSESSGKQKSITEEDKEAGSVNAKVEEKSKNDVIPLPGTLSAKQDPSESDGVKKNEQEIHSELIIEQEPETDNCSCGHGVDTQSVNDQGSENKPADSVTSEETS